MMTRYYNKPEATASVFRNLWFHTGDSGKYDEDRFYYFVDRLQDRIRRRGENISSYELEAVAAEFENVLEAAAVAVPADVIWPMISARCVAWAVLALLLSTSA